VTIDELIDMVKARRDTGTLAVACPYDAVTLKAARDAFEQEIARVLLVGRAAEIERCAGENRIPLDGLAVRETADDTEAVRRAVEACAEGEARMLMKGTIETSLMMSTLLHSPMRMIAEGKILSHVAVFYPPRYGRLMILSDAGININPNLNRKVQIIANTIEVARKLGIKRPRVALLAAIEKLNITKMPITVEAELIEKMGKAGMLGDAYVEGPYALDNAVSMEAAHIKHLSGEVAGKADILIAPDIEAGNILYKAIISFTDLTLASVVVGAKVPVVTPSRADSEKTKLASIALASYLSA